MQAKVYGSFEAVLEDPAVELVVLATPTADHPRMTIAALNAGKHVITDKRAPVRFLCMPLHSIHPLCAAMALSLVDCDAMIAAARKNKRFLSVFQNRRWDSDFLTARKLMAEGSLGPVRWIELSYQVVPLLYLPAIILVCD